MIEYQYNAANQLTREVSNITGVTRYRYDPNGNMIQKRHRWRITRYVYDIEDRLRLAFGPEGLGFYLHDALGRRILRFAFTLKRREAPHFSAGIKEREKRRHRDPDNRQLQRWLDIIAMDLESGCRYGFRHLVRLIDGIKCRLPRKLRRRIVLERYFYDGADVIADYDLFGRRCRASYLTPFLDENLLVDRRFAWKTRRYWYTQDGLGSVRQLVSDNSRVINSYSYTAWGVPLNWHERVSNRYTFTSREYCPETKNYYYRVRSYDAGAGRFAEVEPCADILAYAYCYSNPLLYVDPSGMIAERVPTYLAQIPSPHGVWIQVMTWGTEIVGALPSTENPYWLFAGRKGNETDLKALAKSLVGAAEEWVCIWPVCQARKVLTDKRAILTFGDVFDVSNLTSKKGKQLKMGLYNDQKWVRFFGMTLVPPRKAAAKIAEVSGEGATPIGYLLIGGHRRLLGGVGPKGGVVKGWRGGFKPRDIKRYYDRETAGLSEEQWWERKHHKHGHPICWFTRNARVILAACHSFKYASQFARYYLRGNSWACGTRVPIYVSSSAAGYYLWGTKMRKPAPKFGGVVELGRISKGPAWREVFSSPEKFLGVIPTLEGRHGKVTNIAWACYPAGYR